MTLVEVEMDDKRFWDIISFTYAPEGDDVDWYDNLYILLRDCSPEDIVRFQRRLDRLICSLHTFDHRAASHLINGHESPDTDEEFDAFCCWVIGQGKPFYESVLSDPDGLADHVEPGGLGTYAAEIVGVPYAVWTAELKLYGRDFNDAYEALGEQDRPALAGEPWDYRNENEIRRRLPRLAALYLGEEGPGVGINSEE